MPNSLRSKIKFKISQLKFRPGAREVLIIPFERHNSRIREAPVEQHHIEALSRRFGIGPGLSF